MVAAAEERRFEIRGPMWHKFLEPFQRRAWKEIPREQCWWGPAGTSKTMSCQIACDAILRDPEFHGVRILWLRKTLQSCKQSSLVTFEEQVLDPRDPMLRGKSRMHRESYVYRRKGRINNELVVGGMNIASRWYGAEFDIVVFEEGIEFEQSELEKIWRAMRPRRHGLGLPIKAVIILTNPDSPFHWLYRRMKSGRTESYFVGVECNPAYWSLETNGLTPEGREYVADMRAQMTDERYARLVEGKWVSAEGQILKTFGDVHLVRGEIVREAYKWPIFRLDKDCGNRKVLQDTEIRWFFASMDFGDREPGTIQVWGVTKGGMLVRVAEVYHADRDIKWWAEWCVELYGEFGLRAIVCDSSRPKEIDFINDLIAKVYKLQHVEETNAHGEVHLVAPRIAVGCQKNTQSQDDKTNVALLRYAFGLDNGYPRVLLAEFCERIVDPALSRDAKPLGLIEEIPGWTWKPHDANRHMQGPQELPDDRKPNHGLDAMAYAIAYAWGRNLSRDPANLAPKHTPGSYGHMRRFIPWRDKHVAARIEKEARPHAQSRSTNHQRSR